MLPLTPDQCQILVASKDPKAIANRLRDDQQLCREQLLPSVLVYFLPLSDTILANEIVHHLLPALDVHVPLVVRKLQYEGIINGIEGYLAQMNQISKNANSIYEANVNEDAPFDERGDSAKKFERVDDAFNPRQSHLAGPQLKIALKVLEDLKGRELVNDTTTLASIMRVLQTLIVKAEESTTPLPPQGLEVPQQKCYICRYIIESPHKLYTSLCIPCGDFNLAKGSLSLPKTLDLRGRTAFVTGGRINLGFHTTLRLLRCGAHVIVSSRYPRDAEFRYHDEEDSETWMQRLKIIGADFRTAKDVFRLVSSIQDVLSEWKEERESLGQLFLLINNAAQTLTDPIAAEKKAIANEEHFRRERICNRVVDNGYHPTIRGGSLMPGGLLETSQSGSIPTA
ncbi:uncharacterized protein KY384_004101 [Bacidia gigantensis]|uniref:uncharacterized protein n=1 Tax=Bacidia gigantensis TaxID=2732470 RepID=UPI001D042C23|nr:uncharacterized protein KY384_004101 [Bacidia gigantensis]KAG8530744.1 hypothetical protein KY384_004101 [Bacidia gigantensis]